MQITGTPIHFPVRKTDLQNSFGSFGWISKRENYALTKWVLYLFPGWNVFTLFRFLVSTWEGIYDYSKRFCSKHRSMWWYNKILVLQFELSRSFQGSFNQFSFQGNAPKLPCLFVKFWKEPLLWKLRWVYSPALENMPCQWMYCFLFSLDLDRDSVIRTFIFKVLSRKR